MAIASIFTDASSAMTVISLITFIGILWWTFGVKRGADFDEAAHLPFADDIADGPNCTDAAAKRNTERHHG